MMTLRFKTDLALRSAQVLRAEWFGPGLTRQVLCYFASRAGKRMYRHWIVVVKKKRKRSP